MTDSSKVALEDWVTEYGDYLFKYASLRLGDHVTAKDTLQVRSTPFRCDKLKQRDCDE